MTTLAIIGGGITGLSLLYTLAKEQKQFEKITLFHSSDFAFPCTLHSTAIVAPRGVTSGHSDLGDLILSGLKTFESHVELDRPAGIYKIEQRTAATEKLEAFKNRYPQGSVIHDKFPTPIYTAIEHAYLIDPGPYSAWLLKESELLLKNTLSIVKDFVIAFEEKDQIHLKTVNGRNLSFDKVVFAGGNYNRFWKGLVPGSLLDSSKPVQGCYLEFSDIHWSDDSFSLTLDGENLIWSKELNRLLIGSTTHERSHLLPEIEGLRKIYTSLQSKVSYELPVFESGEVKTGLREKAKKRAPYLFAQNGLIMVGGLYKNGFSLSLEMAKNLSRQFL